MVVGKKVKDFNERGGAVFKGLQGGSYVITRLHGRERSVYIGLQRAATMCNGRIF